MTAVEWLDEKLQDKMFVEYGYINGIRKIVIPLEDYIKFKKQAKEMEKQQIIDAHTKGYIIGGGNGDLYDCKQYFNENFNN